MTCGRSGGLGGNDQADHVANVAFGLVNRRHAHLGAFDPVDDHPRQVTAIEGRRAPVRSRAVRPNRLSPSAIACSISASQRAKRSPAISLLTIDSSRAVRSGRQLAVRVEETLVYRVHQLVFDRRVRIEGRPDIRHHDIDHGSHERPENIRFVLVALIERRNATSRRPRRCPPSRCAGNRRSRNTRRRRSKSHRAADHRTRVSSCHFDIFCYIVNHVAMPLLQSVLHQDA